ncbi:unnamed protein product [Phytomonas sp. Hart1]|nr:unnamed protein product [Phytomonas sp. Hart1]|eukprot:CCW66821.1 unnamed protein product [Phytomonas sp. isolate Hart1]
MTPMSDYPTMQPEPTFSRVTAGRIAEVNCGNHRSAKQQRASCHHSRSMNTAISQSINNSVNTTAGTAPTSCSRSAIPAATQQRHTNFQNSAITNDGMIPSAFAQPVYRPSVSIKYSQFIDIATNIGYMTPFEVPEGNTLLKGPASTPVDASSAGLKEKSHTTNVDQISTSGSFEEPSAAVSHNIIRANPQSACNYPTSQQLLSAPASAPRQALWPQRTVSPQPATQFCQNPRERSNHSSRSVESKSKEESVVIEEKDNHLSTHTDVLSATVARSLSPHPAPKRRGTGAVEMASGLALDGTPLHQTTKLRAGSHQQHTNASILSFFMGMTASTKTVNTPMAQDARCAYHHHAEGDEDDVRVCLNSKLVTPQGSRLLPDDSSCGVGMVNTPTLARSLLTEPNSGVGNPKPTKEPTTTATTHLNGVMQKLLHHIQTKKTLEHRSTTDSTYAQEFSEVCVPSSASINFASAATCSVSGLEARNETKSSDLAVDFHAKSSLAPITEFNRQGMQRGGSRQNTGKEGRQPPRQKHQRDKKGSQPDAILRVRPPAQPNTRTNEMPVNEKTTTRWLHNCDDSKNAKGNGDSIVSRSLQPSLDLMSTPALQGPTDIVEPRPANLRRTPQPPPSAYPMEASSSSIASLRASVESPSPQPAFPPRPREKKRPGMDLPSPQLDPSTGDPKIYSILLEGHMQQRVVALSCVPFASEVCVLFEGDRGMDMGRVVRCEEADETLGMAKEGDPKAGNEKPKKKRSHPFVLRIATTEEQNDWLYKQVEEAQRTIQPCREAVESLGLPLTIVNAVYQFNQEKLTFYYESDVRVDFRQLLQVMFARFYCRIWMERATPLSPTPATGGEDSTDDEKPTTSCNS